MDKKLDKVCHIAYCAVIAFFVVVIAALSVCTIKLLYPTIEIGSSAQIVTAVIAMLAFVLSVSEYCVNKDFKEVQVLSEYNMRYTSDPNIIKVVKYLNYIDEHGKINNLPRVVPSNYEVEMFMRFFEELELQICCGRLKEKDVLDLFIYYAKKLDDEQLRTELGVTDYDNNWCGFRNLLNRNKTNN